MSKKIIANRDGEVLGDYYKKGEAVPVTAAQVKYLMSPYDDHLIFEKPARAAAKKPE